MTIIRRRIVKEGKNGMIVFAEEYWYKGLSGWRWRYGIVKSTVLDEVISSGLLRKPNLKRLFDL